MGYYVCLTDKNFNIDDYELISILGISDNFDTIVDELVDLGIHYRLVNCYYSDFNDSSQFGLYILRDDYCNNPLLIDLKNFYDL